MSKLELKLVPAQVPAHNDQITGFSLSFSRMLLDYLESGGHVEWFNTKEDYDKALGDWTSGQFTRCNLASGVRSAFSFLALQMGIPSPVTDNTISYEKAIVLLAEATAFLDLFPKGQPSQLQDPEIDRMWRYTQAVQKAWDNKQIFEKPEYHDANVEDICTINPPVCLLLDKWCKVIGISRTRDQPKNLYNQLAKVREYLLLL